jgi:multiple sugar transport system substrate-binding protein
MTNEFMRFLIANDQLNEMASIKRLVSPTAKLDLTSVYAPFGAVPADRTISPEVLGITDPLTVQIRVAAFKVGTGELTIDQAVAQYGSFK